MLNMSYGVFLGGPSGLNLITWHMANMESRPMSSETLLGGIGQVAVKYGGPTASRKRELQEKMQVT